EQLWRRTGGVATYVTPRGEVLAPTGRLRGGEGSGDRERSLLARKRQLRELEEQVKQLGETVGTDQTTVGQLEAEIATLRTRIAVGSIRERAEAQGRELVRLDQMATELTDRREAGKTRQRQLGERRVWLEEERQRTDGAARDVAVDRDRAEAAARQTAEAHDA